MPVEAVEQMPPAGVAAWLKSAVEHAEAAERMSPAAVIAEVAVEPAAWSPPAAQTPPVGGIAVQMSPAGDTGGKPAA